MFTVATVNDPSQNLIAPSVYIDGVEKENNTYKIHYSLVDNNNSWMNNEDILSNLSVYISDGVSTEKRLLNTTIAANQIKNNTVKDYAILFNTASSVAITAWVGNENISSSIVAQPVLFQSGVVKASFNGTTYDYVNKIKELHGKMTLDEFKKFIESKIKPSRKKKKNDKKMWLKKEF